MNQISAELAGWDDRVPNKIEWKYEMRRDAQEILPGLWVGPFQPSWNREKLQKMGISHILCIAESREQFLFKAKFPGEYEYSILEMRDADDQNLIRIFPQTYQFIDEALSRNGRVLVHCGDGISRSPAVVTAYVMCKTGMNHEDSFAFVQSRRFCVAPRVEFTHQIQAYQPIFAAYQSVNSDAGARVGQRERRRARDESDEDNSMDTDTLPHDPDLTQRVPQWQNVGVESPA